MYTSDIKKNVKTIFVYICFTIFCAFFGAVYELYSHEVYSYFMIYAFAFPLVLGVLLFSLVLLAGMRFPSRLSFNLYNSGVACLTVGSIMKGVLDIYGTENGLIYVYFIAGFLFSVSGIGIYITKKNKNRTPL